MAGSHAGARLAAVAAVVVLSLVAVPAAAQKVTARDARGDMIRVQEGGSDPRPAPRAMIGDVERTSFRYLDRRVVVRTELAALQRTGRRLTVWVDVQNGARRTWFVGVQATGRDRNGHTIFITARGRDVRCGGVRHRVDYADDVVRVSVPTRCLGRPHVVRFRLATEHVRRSWAYAWLDNGLAVATGDRQWTRWLSRG
jgi:hypothetical protein